MTTIAAKLACLVGLSFFSLLVAAAPPKRMLSIEGSAQKASNLCWAAVTEMAVNAVAHPNPLMTQHRQAAFAAAGITGLPIPPDKLADFNGQLIHCEENIGNCNKRWHPVLEGVTQTMPPSTQPLSPEDLVSEIGDAGRPVIFSWEYPDSNSVNRPTRGHYLIIIGYDTTKPEWISDYLGSVARGRGGLAFHQVQPVCGGGARHGLARGPSPVDAGPAEDCRYGCYAKSAIVGHCRWRRRRPPPARRFKALHRTALQRARHGLLACACAK